jgi:carotenoid cleavage dioxygenase
VHQQDLESWVGIMPRYGSTQDLRWFRGPPGVSVYHIMNAFDSADGRVHLDMHFSDTNAFPFIRADSGIERAQQDIKGGLVRWSFDLSKPGDGFEVTALGPPGDMPRIRDADQGRPYRAGWYLSVNPQGAPPLPGGPVGAAFHLLIRIEPGTGRLDALGLPPAHAINEPVHVPSAIPDHEGWLIAVVDRQEGETGFRSDIWVINAGDVAAGPVAKIRVPMPLRPQVHGWWVPEGELPAS